jgi:hypothetical protein
MTPPRPARRRAKRAQPPPTTETPEVAGQDAAADEPDHPSSDPDPRDQDAAPREAIVFLGGLNMGLTSSKTVAGVVQRIQIACDRHSSDDTEWNVRWRTTAAQKPGASTPPEPIASIVRHRDGADVPVVDFWEYRWSDHVVTTWEDQGVWQRAARMVLSLAGLPALLRFWRTAGRKNDYGRAQILLATLAFAFMLVYSGLLIGATVISAEQAYSIARDTLEGSDGDTATVSSTAPTSQGAATEDSNDSAGSTSSGNSSEDQEVSPVQVVALLLTSGFAALTRQREKARRVGSVLFSAQSYLRVGQGQALASGGLTTLIDELGDGDRYANIRILAYSFGSIVALDTIYPTTAPPVESMRRLTSLVTIGSPFDFVRAVSPNWGQGRHCLPGVPASWTNVFSTIDLLGSNFRDDRESTDATVDAVSVADGPPQDAVLKPTQNEAWNLGIALSLGNLLEFYGFAGHGLYWGADDEDDSNVFDYLIPTLYAGTSVFETSATQVATDPAP